MSVRTKFRVSSVTSSNYNKGIYDADGKFVEAVNVEVKNISLHAVYDGSEENKQFFEATPAGSINFSTVIAAAAEQFEAGDEFYVDLIKVEKKAE